MAFVKAEIETIVVGNGPVSSLLVLKAFAKQEGAPGKSTRPKPLPIRIGSAEAANIGMLLSASQKKRPMTFDLMANLLSQMGAKVISSAIVGVKGTTFFARINLAKEDGTEISIDARPSDAIAIAIKCRAPLFVDEEVLATASLPDFDKIKRQEEEANLEEFEQFVKTIKPEDFA